MSYTIPPQAYLIDNYATHRCAVGIAYISDSYNMYVLGEVFMRSFYTALDFGTNQVILAVSSNAYEGVLIDRGQKLNGWQIFGLFIAGTICALIIGIGSYCGIKQCVIKIKASKNA